MCVCVRVQEYHLKKILEGGATASKGKNGNDTERKSLTSSSLHIPTPQSVVVADYDHSNPSQFVRPDGYIRYECACVCVSV